MFGVGDSVPDDVLKEHLQDTPGLLVDEARDTLDTATASQTPDGGLGDALDVIPEHLPVALGASLSESLASLAASSHDEFSVGTDTTSPCSANIYTLLFPPLIGPSLQSNEGRSFAEYLCCRYCVSSFGLFSSFEKETKKDKVLDNFTGYKFDEAQFLTKWWWNEVSGRRTFVGRVSGFLFDLTRK